MNSLLALILLALLPALGNAIGNLVAEMYRMPRWVTGVLLHCATGIVIALICFSLFPTIAESVPVWNLVIAFLLGAMASVALAYCVHHIGKSHGSHNQAWLVYVAIAADLFSDGMMTGAGSAIDFKLGAMIAGVQLLANIPGGVASAANLRQRSVSRRARLLAAVGLFGGVVVSAALGFLLLRDQSELVQNTVLAGMTGLLLLATIEDMVPEADAPRPSRWLSSSAFSLGFVGMVLISHYLPQS